MGSTRVTIGFPVYNGARFLEATLAALLVQDLGYFELVVSDNASTDETPAILARFAARDRRMRVVRQGANVGASRNFGIVLAEARTPCFLWAAHDDRFAPSYLRKTLAALDANPSAVLAVSRVRFIDGDGKPIERLADEPNLHTLGLTRVERLRRLFVRRRGVAIYGLGRTELFRELGMEKPVIGQDLLALAHLLLRGDVVQVDEELFDYRIERSKKPADYHRQIGADPAITQPYTRLFTEAMRMLFASDWSEPEKEEAFVAAVTTIARENGAWRRLIAREHFFRVDRLSRRLFASRLCWIAGRGLAGGTQLGPQLARQGRLQRAFGSVSSPA